MGDFQLARIITKTIRFIEKFFRKKTYILLRPIIRRMSGYLILTNEVDSKQDGVGAQAQRSLAIAALANDLRISFQQTDIKQVAIHPLDPYQVEEEYFSFLSELNRTLDLGITVSIESNLSTEYIEEITIWKLLQFSFQSKIRREKLLIETLSPYKILDLIPDAYLDVRELLSTFYSNYDEGTSSMELVIHYRQGVGGQVIYPGQKISRELNEDYFLAEITKLEDVNFTKMKCTVLTDAPEEDIFFRVPEEQKYLWENTPEYSDGVMHIKGNTFPKFREYFSDIEIIRGGNPLQAMKIMSKASYLLLSRSSLSYLGGILNLSGVVFSATGFWHPPLSKWISGNVK